VDERTAIIVGTGTTVIVAAGKQDTAGFFALLDYELAPGFPGAPPHVHRDEDGGIYVLEGQLLVCLGETERIVGPGEFIFLPRGVAHAERNCGTEPVRFLALLVPAGFEQFFCDLDATLQAGALLSRETVLPLLASYGVRPAAGTEADT
jgi:quercetin dioxygenase-like cupin family protein